MRNIVLLLSVFILVSCQTTQKSVTYGKEAYANSEVKSSVFKRNYKNLSKDEAINKLKEFDTAAPDIHTQANKNGSYTTFIQLADRQIEHTFEVKNYFPSFRIIFLFIFGVAIIILLLIDQFKISLPQIISNVRKSLSK